LKSRPYIDLTLDIMEKFGVKVENKNYREFFIKAGQKYRGREYEIEGDYSSASYFLALAAMTHSEITVKNLFKKSKQGDRKLLDILKKMGAEVTVRDREVTVKGAKLQGIRADLGDAPDLLPAVAALACKARGKTVIKNVEHARFKESDRIAACSSELSKFGVDIEEKKDGLVIYGTGRLTGARVNSTDKLGMADHRMAMALAVAGLAAEGETSIENAECVEISFPDFFNILRSLGIILSAP
ncbi:MAG: 3-phosphoshikimate 1-carboxyvinyltransferase, partial [Candidatus Hydrothermarchaeota archaeon]|nr:3-phosphoshikimate 1-carboxyvinyltransferase [Candidatus Hydrothermarchaeota archaeon]